MSRRMKKWIESCLPVPDLTTFAIPAASKQRRSARLAKRQERTGHYRAEQRQKESKAAARLAMNKTKSKLRANEKEVLEGMEDESEKEDRLLEIARKQRKDAAKSAPIPPNMRMAACATVENLTEDWKEGGSGKLQLPKPDGVVRVELENANSLCIKNGLGPRQTRPAIMDQMRRNFSSDVLCTVELQRNMDLVDKSLQYEELFGIGEEKVGVAGWNKHCKIFNQPGGTGTIAFGALSAYARAGKDESGLGRLVWLLIEYNGHKFRFVTGYRPCDNRTKAKGKKGLRYTVWHQHYRYYRSIGIKDPDVRDLYDDYLFSKVEKWRSEGEKIVLAIDANEPVYKGKFADRLADPNINLESAYTRVHKGKMPPSHADGSEPIMGLFASPDVDCLAYFIGRLKLGVGDHRGPHFLDVPLSCVLGSDELVPRSVSGRLLQVKDVPRCRKTYNKKLLGLGEEHKMPKKIKKIGRRAKRVADLPNDAPAKLEVMAQINHWDKQYQELQLGSEKKCRKKRVGPLPFCLEVKAWVDRRNLLHWLKRYIIKKNSGKNHKIKKKRLARICGALKLPHPSKWTLEMVLAELKICVNELREIKPDAAKKHKELLIERLEVHVENGDDDAAEQVKRIIQREGSKHHRRIKRHFGSTASLPVSKVATIRTEGGRVVHSRKVDVNRALRDHLKPRFQTSRVAPIAQGQLLQDLGHLADTSAAKAILQGTYEFPPGTDEATILVLKAAAKIYAKNKGVVDLILRHRDFKFWLKAKERTESSASRLHFGHYMAQAFSDRLTETKVAQLNIVLMMGMPLERWLHGLTVMLEKERGNINVEKLRAICLFEADLNWVLKVIYAKRMMANAYEHDLVPPEIFAVAGRSAPDATMAKIMFTDICRTQHRNHAVASVDLGQCYDAVAHGFCSLALQAFGVPIKGISLMLLTLQTMNFWLKTAFGEADESFGGSLEDPCYGIGQGAGSAPPTYTAASTVAITAYKEKDFHPILCSAITGCLLTLAAALFVDDTDQFHLAKDEQTEEEFILQVQAAVTFWGMIVLATGGYLKQSKCQVGLVLFRFVNGKATVKTGRFLPKFRFTIPQAGGDSVPIPTIDPGAGTKSLGVVFDLLNKCTHQLAKISKKGLEWAARLNSDGYISKSDAWCSFDYQLKPALAYSILTMSADPDKVDEAQRGIFFKSLSRLGVNCNIRETVRRMPVRYGGLGMFDLNILCLGEKLHHVRSFWGTPTEEGRQLLHMYETFLMDVGLSGDVLTRDFNALGYLAEHSWFKNLWQLCHRFQCTLTLDFPENPQRGREGDRALIEVFIESGLYSKRQIEILQRVRRFKKAHFLSDVLCADGCTVRPDMRTNVEIHSRRVFSLERPTRPDFDLWRQALRDTTSSQYTLESPLGCYLILPHNADDWFASDNESKLFRKLDDGKFDVYSKLPDSRTPRRPRYKLTESSQILPDDGTPKVATVLYSAGADKVSLHSTARVPQEPQARRQSVPELLRSTKNSSLWRDFKCDGDGWWIRDALFGGTLRSVSDGSYMPDKHVGACSAGFTLKCRKTGKQATCSWAEVQEGRSDNYRGELLGAVGILSVLHAILSDPSSLELLRDSNTEVATRVWTDCKGVINHGNDPRKKLTQKQAHADLICVLRALVIDLPIRVKFKHVKGHRDDHIPYHLLTHTEQLNCDMDELAKKALIKAIKRNRFIRSEFPCEMTRIFVQGRKVVRSPTEALYKAHGRDLARDYLSSRSKLPRDDFDLVDWDALERAMGTWPRMYRIFYTKHVTGCCAVRHFQHEITKGQKPSNCPCCPDPDETTYHVLLCENPTRRKLYSKSIDKLEDWLERNDTKPELAEMIIKYLRGRGKVTMCSCHRGRRTNRSRLWRLAKEHDRLGWKNFTEGRFSMKFERAQRKYYTEIESRRSSAKWAAELVHQIFRLTHLQWTYRNNYIHYRVSDGAETVDEYEARMARIEETLELTDPEDLLEEDRHLVEEYTLAELAEAETNTRIVWEESVESARSAAFFARMRQVLEDTECVNSAELQAPYFRPPPERDRRSQPQESD